MRSFKLSGTAFLATILFLAVSCTQDSVTPPNGDESLTFNGKNAADCFNFQASAEGLEVGCACIPAPLVCPPSEANFCGFGALVFPVTIGDYDGFMGSVVTGMEQEGNGALHLTLVHYFVTTDGNNAFWTDDQVVCAPADNDPSTCLINDVLNIVGGCGDFEGAFGKFHNHGMLFFDGNAEPCPEGSTNFVPTGTVDANLHGRICFPNL